MRSRKGEDLDAPGEGPALPSRAACQDEVGAAAGLSSRDVRRLRRASRRSFAARACRGRGGTVFLARTAPFRGGPSARSAGRNSGSTPFQTTRTRPSRLRVEDAPSRRRSRRRRRGAARRARASAPTAEGMRRVCGRRATPGASTGSGRERPRRRGSSPRRGAIVRAASRTSARHSWQPSRERRLDPERAERVRIRLDRRAAEAVGVLAQGPRQKRARPRSPAGRRARAPRRSCRSRCRCAGRGAHGRRSRCARGNGISCRRIDSFDPSGSP
jgi:hypothetical protein